jgi:hypothetical protein
MGVFQGKSARYATIAQGLCFARKGKITDQQRIYARKFLLA